MKKFFSVLYAAIILIGGIHKSGTPDINSAGKFFQPLCDNEPIVMHAHIRTSGGIAIPGTAVTLMLQGTSTPQYSGTTDSNGDFTFDSVNQGNYHYKMSKTGYYDKTVNLSLHVNTDRTDTLIAQ